MTIRAARQAFARTSLFILLLLGGVHACSPASAPLPTEPTATPTAAVSQPPASTSAVASAQPPDRCPTANSCSYEGLCQLRDGKCAATQDAHCQSSVSCKSGGRCTAHDGQCTWDGTSESDCRKPRGKDGHNPCVHYARCSFRDGVCALLSDADCQQGERCTSEGACSFKDGKCQVLSDADCAQACRAHGRCKFGMSRLHGGSKPIPSCIAIKNADCLKSKGCIDDGTCKLSANTPRCVAGTDAQCARSRACRDRGLCKSGFAHGWPDPRCVAVSDTLCRRSSNCKQAGSCHLVVQPPPFMMAVCGAKSKTDCKRSDACRLEGYCQLEPNETYCKVGGDDDCRKSQACKKDGRCSFDANAAMTPCVKR